MAQIVEAIAVGIGPQVDQTTVNAFVRDATALQTTVADGSGATGILLRNPEDLSKSMDRIESEGGVVPGSFSKVPGVLQRIDATVSFVIDAMGNRLSPATPAAGEFTFDEYFKQILAGAGLIEGVEDAAFTPYNLGPIVHQTIKIWRGTTESWTLVGCALDLAFSHVAGEKNTITVTLNVDSVIYANDDTFPPEDLATAYGNQRLSAPILKSAGSTLNGITRGFISADLTVSYDTDSFGDCNAPEGELKNQTGLTIAFSADYYADTLETDGDFTGLEDELDSGVSPLRQMTFRLGAAAGAGDVVNAMTFDIPNFAYLTVSKVDAADKVVRTISGEARVAGASGTGSAADEEFELRAV